MRNAAGSSIVPLALVAGALLPFGAAALAQGRLPPGALLAYSFDRETLFDEDGAWMALDLSGKEAHGRIQGFEAARGVAGGCLRFSGDAVVEVPYQDALKQAAALTLSVWCRVEALRGANYLVSSEDWAAGKVRGFVLRLDREGRPDFTIGSRGWVGVKGEPLETGRWHHLAATYDPQEIALWVDGRRVAAADARGALEPSSYGLTIGRGNYDKQRKFSGEIDEVALFDRVLSGAEIQALALTGVRNQDAFGLKDFQALITRKGEAVIAVSEPREGEDRFSRRDGGTLGVLLAYGKPGAELERLRFDERIAAAVPHGLIESPAGRPHLLAGLPRGQAPGGSFKYRLCLRQGHRFCSGL
jgi:hypothetical protein